MRKLPPPTAPAPRLARWHAPALYPRSCFPEPGRIGGPHHLASWARATRAARLVGGRCGKGGKRNRPMHHPHTKHTRVSAHTACMLSSALRKATRLGRISHHFRGAPPAGVCGRTGRAMRSVQGLGHDKVPGLHCTARIDSISPNLAAGQRPPPLRQIALVTRSALDRPPAALCHRDRHSTCPIDSKPAIWPLRCNTA